jgi:DNA-binding NarL/FixJ family response regulator
VIQLLIADDHPAVVRDGLRGMVASEPDLEVVSAIEAGATGFLLKDAPRAELFRAVRAAARGETVLAPEVATRLVGQLREPAAQPLTQRELQVLELVARGPPTARSRPASRSARPRSRPTWSTPSASWA